MRLDAELFVTLKGVDLVATTARLTLAGPMGYGGTLLGLKRFDYFRFEIDSPAPAPETVAALSATLARQSTFYNRNKHLYALECRWPGGTHGEGAERAEMRRRWLAETAGAPQNWGGKDFDGKESREDVILERSNQFLVEMLVEDDEPTARDAVAAKIEAGLEGGSSVRCSSRATLWWLALAAPDTDAARTKARDISVTTRRDRGLLLNPNFQNLRIVSVAPIETTSR